MTDFRHAAPKKSQPNESNNSDDQNNDLSLKKPVLLGQLNPILLDEKMEALYYPHLTNGLCFLTTQKNREGMHNALQNTVLSILQNLPGGMARVKMFDTTGLGNNLISLSQLSSKIKGEKILSEADQLKNLLKPLVDTIPDIFQKVLGPKYQDKTLVDYNEEAGELAKPYQFLVITDYPHTFTPETNELLKTMLKEGRRAGIYTFLSLDTGFVPEKRGDIDPLGIINEIACIYQKGQDFCSKGFEYDRYFNQKLKFRLRTKLPHNLEEIIEKVNHAAQNVKDVKISFLDQFNEENLWSKDAASGIETPIGKYDVVKTQNLKLSIEDGSIDTPHHCLIGGGTGSGKTVLLHNIICNTAWLYSPQQVQFLLLDYKEGTEFKIYETLPHVKVLSIRSEREFGISVLEYLNNEMERRGELFKEKTVSNIGRYNELAQEKLPRLVLIIDEFQKLFDGTPQMANQATKALDDLGRRGRSFGVNLILSTQSLAGININQILSHMGLRIALKLNTQRDCDQLLGFNNHEPFGFTRKGQAIYNSRSGLVEGNQPMQVAYIEDKDIDQLTRRLRTHSDETQGKSPFKQFIYDGSLRPQCLSNPKYLNDTVNKNVASIFIGESLALQEEHIYFKFRKQNESNVLIVGQDIESAVSIFKHAFAQVYRQSPQESQFFLFNKLNVDSEFYPMVEEMEHLQVEPMDKKIEQHIEQIHGEMMERIDGKESQTRIILGFFDINNIRSLRKKGMMPSPLTTKLNEILADGPGVNIHTMVYAYSYQSLNNTLDTMKSIHDFDTRIALKGGESHRILSMNLSAGIDKAGTSLISSPFSQENEILKIYNL